MKDEIKEILEELKEKNETYEECSGNGIIENEYYKSHLLLDYITNLQEENFNYRKLGFKHLCDKNKELEEENEKLNKELDYANNDNIYYIAKIDKAIEYINKNKHLSMFADCREPEEDWNYELEINPRDLLNILNGDENENL